MPLSNYSNLPTINRYIASCSNQLQQKSERRRGQLKSVLSRFDTYLSKFNPEGNTTIANLQARLDKVLPIYEKFDLIQFEIESLNEDDFDGQELQRAEFEDTHLENAKNRISNLSNQNNHSKLNNNANGNLNTQTILPTLPAITIPEFNGSYGNWTTFKQTFDSLLH